MTDNLESDRCILQIIWRKDYACYLAYLATMDLLAGLMLGRPSLADQSVAAAALYCGRRERSQRGDNAQEQPALVLGRLHFRCWNGEAVQVLFSLDC